MSSELLPSNATRLEREFADAVDRVGEIGAPMRALWSPDDCPLELLPYLAWTFSVDVWDAAWREEIKRDVVRQSIRIHRTKGSVGSVRRLLIAAGVGGAQIVERLTANHDGSRFHDGTLFHDTTAWARWRVFISRPLTIAQGQAVRALLETVQPIRCHLEALEFTQAIALHDGERIHDGSIPHGGVIQGVPLFHDGTIAHDGTFSHGAV